MKGAGRGGHGRWQRNTKKFKERGGLVRKEKLK